MKESFGAGFLSGLGDTTESTDALTDSLRDLQPAMEGLGAMVATQVNGLGDLAKIMNLLEGETVDADSGFVTFMKTVKTFNPTPLEWVSSLSRDLEKMGVGLEAVNSATVDSAIAAGNAITPMAGFSAAVGAAAEEAEQAAEAAAEAAEKFDLFTAAMSRTNAVMGYQSALDDLKESLADNGKVVSIFTNKGRDNADALLGVAEAAVKAMEATDSQAQKALLASGALDTLKSTMNNTKMDPGTRAALIEPFQALLDDLVENGVNVDSLQRKLDALKSKTITVTTRVVTLGDGTYAGTPPPGGYSSDGGTGDGKKNRTGIRSAGISIGSITVQSAPGERAEESVPEPCAGSLSWQV